MNSDNLSLTAKILFAIMSGAAFTLMALPLQARRKITISLQKAQATRSGTAISASPTASSSPEQFRRQLHAH
jgi:hypothetical protein